MGTSVTLPPRREGRRRGVDGPAAAAPARLLREPVAAPGADRAGDRPPEGPPRLGARAVGGPAARGPGPVRARGGRGRAPARRRGRDGGPRGGSRRPLPPGSRPRRREPVPLRDARGLGPRRHLPPAARRPAPPGRPGPGLGAGRRPRPRRLHEVHGGRARRAGVGRGLAAATRPGRPGRPGRVARGRRDPARARRRPRRRARGRPRREPPPAGRAAPAPRVGPRLRPRPRPGRGSRRSRDARAAGPRAVAARERGPAPAGATGGGRRRPRGGRGLRPGHAGGGPRAAGLPERPRLQRADAPRVQGPRRRVDLVGGLPGPGRRRAHPPGARRRARRPGVGCRPRGARQPGLARRGAGRARAVRHGGLLRPPGDALHRPRPRESSSRAPPSPRLSWCACSSWTRACARSGGWRRTCRRGRSWT